VNFYFAPGVVQSIVIGVSVCLSVFLYVCSLAYLKNYMSVLHEIFCTCYLWLWLGPPLTAIQFVNVLPICG